MKKIVVTITFLAAYNLVLSQETLSINQVTGDHAVFDGVKSQGKSLTYDEIQGSPYHDKNFYKAKVSDNHEEVSVRYNNFRDEIEFQKESKILVLPKENTFSRIEIKSPKQTFILLNTNDDLNDDLNGYFIELINGKYSLYKKEKIIFKDAVPAANSYASGKPASFKKLPSAYYIRTEHGTFIKKPKNQKDIIVQFPDKKERLNDFIKSNKIKFDKDEDLIKLVNFLNQN